MRQESPLLRRVGYYTLSSPSYPFRFMNGARSAHRALERELRLSQAISSVYAWAVAVRSPESLFARDVRRRPYTLCMTPKLSEYIEAGYALTPDERLEAARVLRLSVDQDTDREQAEIDAAWDDVIDQRVAEVIRGDARLVDGREAMARVRADLAARRR
jgi:hypothetical protein